MPNTTSAAHALASSTVDAAGGDTPHGTGKGKDRPVDEYGNPVLPWAFIDCDTDDLVVLIGESLLKVFLGARRRRHSHHHAGKPY